MLLKTSKEAKTYPKVHIPAGIYKSTLLEVKPSEDNTRIRFVFVINEQVDSENKPITLVYSAPTGEEYTPNTKIGQLLLALGFELGSEINTDLMISKECQSKVEDYAKQVEGKVEMSSFIGEVFPLNKLE